MYISKPLINRLPLNYVQNTNTPIFGGITSAVPNSDGSIDIAWNAASANGADLPIRYEVFIALGNVNAAALFQVGNIEGIVFTLNDKIITLADQLTYLVKGQQYTVGVRALSSNGFSTSNTELIVVTAIASGNFPVIMQSFLDQMDAQNDTYDTLNSTHDSLNDTHSTNNTNQATNNSDMDSLIDTLQTISSAIAGGGGTEMTLQDSELIMEVTDTEVSMEVTDEEEI